MQTNKNKLSFVTDVNVETDDGDPVVLTITVDYALDGAFVMYYEDGSEADRLHEDADVMANVQELVDERIAELLEDAGA